MPEALAEKDIGLLPPVMLTEKENGQVTCDSQVHASPAMIPLTENDHTLPFCPPK